MKSQWTDADARKAVETYGAKGVSEDLALRTYTTRLLGRDPMLVLHGGGNTSVKTTAAGFSFYNGQCAHTLHGQYIKY